MPKIPVGNVDANGSKERIHVSRRILADGVGFCTLAALVALFVCAMPGSNAFAVKVNDFLLGYIPLMVGGYIGWTQMHKKMPEPRWLLQAVTSIGVGAISFLVDTFVGSLQGHPWQLSSPFSAAASTGIMFGVTLLICPGYTFIAFSGWTRSLVPPARPYLNASGEH